MQKYQDYSVPVLNTFFLAEGSDEVFQIESLVDFRMEDGILHKFINLIHLN